MKKITDIKLKEISDLVRKIADGEAIVSRYYSGAKITWYGNYRLSRLRKVNQALEASGNNIYVLKQCAKWKKPKSCD